MANQRFISVLALSAVFFALSVIALGAFTRLIDAGLGCPDWPSCYGQLIVPVTKVAQQLANLHYPETPLEIYKAWAEMLHRYFVGGLSFFILTIIIMILKNRFTTQNKTNMVFAILLLLLLTYQIMLGRWTVTLKLLPVIVSQHLLGGFLILAVLWLIYLNNNVSLKNKLKNTSNLKKLLPWTVIALVLLFFQILLGAWTSTHYASLSCSDFPFCTNDQWMTWHWKEAFNLFSPVGVNYEGGVLPTAIRQTIHMAHRLGALIFTLYILIFMGIAAPLLKNIPELIKSIYFILGLLCLQLCIGITNVIFKLPLITAVSHTLVGALLWINLVGLIFKLILTNKSEAHHP